MANERTHTYAHLNNAQLKKRAHLLAHDVAYMVATATAHYPAPELTRAELLALTDALGAAYAMARRTCGDLRPDASP